MRHKIIICDTDKCTGCRICEYACAAARDSSLNLRHSRMKTIRLEPVFNAAISCVLCSEPKCVEGCPTQAIEFDEKQKIIRIDEELCVACGLCIERCPYGSISLELKGDRAFVCDFCEDFDEPQCIVHCPKDALRYHYANEKNFQGKIKKDDL